MSKIAKRMADRLVIRGLAALCRIGVFGWEQAEPQKILLDLEVEIDAAKAAARDDVNDALDYGKIVTVVRQLVEHKSYRLLETMAEDVAALILQGFDTPQVIVRVKKQALPGIGSAEVELMRSLKAG